MKNRNIISSLIGLVGAISNNGKTENTDSIIIEALQESDSDLITEKIRKEKYRISPGCESCQNPCGNTSDYDMALFDNQPEEIKNIKLEIIHELTDIADILGRKGMGKSMGRNSENESKPDFPEICLRAIAYLGYNLEMDSYKNVLEEMRNVKTDY